MNQKLSITLPTFFLVIALGSVASATAAGSTTAGPTQEGRAATHVIVLQADVDVDAAAQGLARAHGLTVTNVYRHALRGMAAVVPEGRLEALRRDPRVASVETNVAYTVADQSVPTGIDRIEADRNPATGIGSSAQVSINLDVAIIDTGINAHEDLSIAGCINFAGGSPNNCTDGYGHGTHVAGTVGALDNSIGVVGVAPGVRLWAVRVCNNGGICLTSNMIAGLDWVAGRKSDGDPGVNFAVANMSLGTGDEKEPCNGSSGALHRAVCGVVNGGVVLALAAGNSGVIKNAYPEAFTVAAIADFDGKGGEAGAATCRADEDDSLANFSNFGSTVDIAAPGVCILSTSSGGGYVLGSGTSMASPHAAGAVALYLHANGLSPATNAAGVATIEAAIRGAALPEGVSPTNPCSYNNERDTAERLLFVNAAAFGGDGTCDVVSAVPVTDVAITAVSAPSSAIQGDLVNVDVTVKNVGNQDVISDIAVTVVSDNATPSDATDDIAIGTQTMSGGLVAGASTTLTFAWNTAGANIGDHTLTASHNFSDDDATNNSKTTTVAITEAPSIVLTATGYKVKGLQKADLSWTTGAMAATVDVYRDGAFLDSTANDGFYIDNINKRGGGTYVYKVCEAGTSTCSNEAVVTFG